jgi:hypothetical protein
VAALGEAVEGQAGGEGVGLERDLASSASSQGGEGGGQGDEGSRWPSWATKWNQLSRARRRVLGRVAHAVQLADAGALAARERELVKDALDLDGAAREESVEQRPGSISRSSLAGAWGGRWTRGRRGASWATTSASGQSSPESTAKLALVRGRASLCTPRKSRGWRIP